MKSNTSILCKIYFFRYFENSIRIYGKKLVIPNGKRRSKITLFRQLAGKWLREFKSCGRLCKSQWIVLTWPTTMQKLDHVGMENQHGSERRMENPVDCRYISNPIQWMSETQNKSMFPTWPTIKWTAGARCRGEQAIQSSPIQPVVFCFPCQTPHAC